MLKTTASMLKITASYVLSAGLALLAAIECYRVGSYELIGSDFRSTIWEPAHALVSGESPYGLGDLAGSVYPPSAFVPVVWLGWLPFDVAAIAWTVVSLVAAFGTLWVLEVRDWRCYALWMLNAATLSTALTGNATTIVVLLIAVMCRYRESSGVAGAALGGSVAIKLFAAPLAVWLAATGRPRAAFAALATSGLAIAGCWAAIGFDGVTGYVGVLQRNGERFSADGPFLQGLLQQLGVGRVEALGAGIAAATILLGCSWLARREDARSFTLALLAVIVLPPVAWVGYAMLLVIPLAARSPRFDAWWLVLGGFAYVHWWDSPLAFRSVGLSIATLALTALLAARGLGIGPTRGSARALGSTQRLDGPEPVARART
jgi:hypothetical protein